MKKINLLLLLTSLGLALLMSSCEEDEIGQVDFHEITNDGSDITSSDTISSLIGITEIIENINDNEAEGRNSSDKEKISTNDRCKRTQTHNYTRIEGSAFKVRSYEGRSKKGWNEHKAL